MGETFGRKVRRIHFDGSYILRDFSVHFDDTTFAQTHALLLPSLLQRLRSISIHVVVERKKRMRRGRMYGKVNGISVEKEEEYVRKVVVGLSSVQ